MALQAESVIMLKNDGVLPLAKPAPVACTHEEGVDYYYQGGPWGPTKGVASLQACMDLCVADATGRCRAYTWSGDECWLKIRTPDLLIHPPVRCCVPNPRGLGDGQCAPRCRCCGCRRGRGTAWTIFRA